MQNRCWKKTRKMMHKESQKGAQMGTNILEKHESHQPSGLRWIRSTLVSIPLPLPGGGIFPSPYPLPWGWRSPKWWLLGSLALADFIKSESSCFGVVFPRLLTSQSDVEKHWFSDLAPNPSKTKKIDPGQPKLTIFIDFGWLLGTILASIYQLFPTR